LTADLGTSRGNADSAPPARSSVRPPAGGAPARRALARDSVADEIAMEEILVGRPAALEIVEDPPGAPGGPPRWVAHEPRAADR
jgi:hypothetical protein